MTRAGFARSVGYASLPSTRVHVPRRRVDRLRHGLAHEDAGEAGHGNATRCAGAHHSGPKRTLTESSLWIRRIASPMSGATERRTSQLSGFTSG